MVPALRKLKQEDEELAASLGYLSSKFKAS